MTHLEHILCDLVQRSEFDNSISFLGEATMESSEGNMWGSRFGHDMRTNSLVNITAYH